MIVLATTARVEKVAVTPVYRTREAQTRQAALSKGWCAFTLAALAACCFAPSITQASTNGAVDISWAVQIAGKYRLKPNITYFTAQNIDLKLDVYSPVSDGKLKPTLMYIHGGGWMEGYTKEMAGLALLPFLQLGWVVVNVDYRPSSVSLAPAAVEDCLCALRWIGRNAKEYNVDTKQIVIMGHSSGGHLALTTGMIPLSASGLGGPCVLEDMYTFKPEPVRIPPTSLKPAAVISWSGITDVADLAEGPNQHGYAVRWLGNQPQRMAVAHAVSPLSYVRADLPPIISVHGDGDAGAPYTQAVRLHEALTKAGVRNRLITIHGEGHILGLDATRYAYSQVLDFLKDIGVAVRAN